MYARRERARLDRDACNDGDGATDGVDTRSIHSFAWSSSFRDPPLDHTHADKLLVHPRHHLLEDMARASTTPLRAGTGAEHEAGAEASTSSSPASASPASAKSKAQNNNGTNAKKRKRADDGKASRRTKGKHPHGVDGSPVADSDDGAASHAGDKVDTTAVKQEDMDAAMDVDVDASSSDAPLAPADAERILLVLERSVCLNPSDSYLQTSSSLHSADPANVLDLVHTTKGTAATLRQLLTNPSSTTLRALRDRIHQQAATPSPTTNTHHHHRASTSRCAAHAKADPALARFYHLAQELIDDVASSSASASYLDQSYNDTDGVVKANNNPLASPTYALYQHLPTGDYFTSAASGLSRADLKSLPRGSFCTQFVLSSLPHPYHVEQAKQPS